MGLLSTRTSLLAWPYQYTSYRSALPGVAGPGLDFGTDLPSKLYFITSLDETSVGDVDLRGPNCFSGTARYCWDADQGSGYHKFIIPLISGYCYIGRRVTGPVGRGNMDYVGHGAPRTGFIWRCCGLRTGGGENIRLWHLASWCGDEASASGVSNFNVDTRDAFGVSQTGEVAGTEVVINGDFRFSMDEAFECFYPMSSVSLIRTAIYDPLHTPPDFTDEGIPNHGAANDHGFGYLCGGSVQGVVDNSLASQSLFAHTTDRNPTVRATNHLHVNNLHYNHGRVGGGKGEALHIDDHSGSSVIMQANMVGNVSVRGPEQNTQLTLGYASTAIPAGSTGHSAYNSAYGWTQPANQDEFFTTKPANYTQSTLRSSALYDGFGSDYAGILKPCVSPLNPTEAELLAYVQLMKQTVGCKPNRRHLYAGGLHLVFNQIEDKIRGISGSAEYINEVSELGWPTISSATVDPASPGATYWAAMPLDATRDDIVPNGGTLLDGSSSDGFTYFRRWMINQYHWVMRR